MTEPSRRTHVIAAAVVLAGAAGLAWASHARDPALQVPPVVGYVVAATLAAAGAALVAKAFGRTQLQSGLAVAILAGFAVVGGWIALAPDGARGCRASPSLIPGAGSAAACRTAFGVGALLTTAMATWAAALWWRGRRRR